MCFTAVKFRTGIANSNTDFYKCSFFLQTIRDWNVLPDSFISSAAGAKDGVAKFTSLATVRATFRDYSIFPGHGPGE